jgi:hypothetical protein
MSDRTYFAGVCPVIDHDVSHGWLSPISVLG